MVRQVSVNAFLMAMVLFGLHASQLVYTSEAHLSCHDLSRHSTAQSQRRDKFLFIKAVSFCTVSAFSKLLGFVAQ